MSGKSSDGKSSKTNLSKANFLNNNFQSKEKIDSKSFSGFFNNVSSKPSKARPFSMFDPNKAIILNKKTFHKTLFVVDPITNKKYYHKENTIGSPMSQIEAILCDYYRVLAYNYVPSAHAAYNEAGKYNGVSTNAIKIKTLQDDEAENHPLSSDILNNSEYKKGLAITLVASYIFKEDDLHKGNLAKDGKRIDFDMSKWDLLYVFKDRTLIDWKFREPSPHQFDITERDIREFPHLQDAKPFYWPTSPAPIIREPTRSLIAKVLPLSQNAYNEKDNAIFQLLKHDEDFNYYKFRTFTMYLLTKETLYKNIAEMHLNAGEIKLNDKDLLERLMEDEKNRMDELKKVLINMPEYYKFIEQHGERAKIEILEEIGKYNDRIQKKINKYNDFINKYHDLIQKESSSEIKDDYIKLREKYEKLLKANMKLFIEDAEKRYEELCVETAEKSCHRTVCKL
ncbi:MAG: hypothetical protein ACD_46C00519G0001 [uncultured bacterium]|nr:MAG: hypothetical protein ACD_46C00519G0001 [uncultured bacterium]